MSLTAERLDRIQPSLTIAISTVARRMIAEGKNVISLSQGEPDFDTPRNIKDAAIRAMVTALFLTSACFAQGTGGDKVDLDALAQIKTEAFQHSQVMENLFWMSEVYGPRVTNSRNHKLAAEWAMKQMKAWGLQNVHLEKWPFGYGWQITHFYAAMETPVYAAFTGFPLAWTPGTNGPITVEPVWAPIHSKADFAKYHGKLKGKALLMFDPAPLTLHTRADAQPSPTDEEILARGGTRGGGVGGGRGTAAGATANRDPSGRGRPGEGEWEYTPTSLALANEKNGVLRNEVNAFLRDEGVAISITPGYNGDGGTIFSTYGGSENPNDPVPSPIVAIGAARPGEKQGGRPRGGQRRGNLAADMAGFAHARHDDAPAGRRQPLDGMAEPIPKAGGERQQPGGLGVQHVPRDLKVREDVSGGRVMPGWVVGRCDDWFIFCACALVYGPA